MTKRKISAIIALITAILGAVAAFTSAEEPASVAAPTDADAETSPVIGP